MCHQNNLSEIRTQLISVNKKDFSKVVALEAAAINEKVELRFPSN